MKKTPLKRVSKKRQQQLRLYSRLKKAFLFGLRCEFFRTDGCVACVNKAVDVHHAKGRNGERLLDQAHWWALCREHHRWIHDNPKEARQMGLLK